MKKSENSVSDIFKARALPRKRISSLFSQKESSISVTASQNIPLGGQRAKYYPPAIDVGSTSIKLLQLAKTSRGYEIAKIAFSPLEKSAKTLVDLKAPLKSLVKENKLRGEIVGVLPLSLMQVYNFFLPEMPEAEIEQAVIWKLKQNPPQGMPFGSFSFDFIYFGQSESSLTNEIRVILFVASKVTVMERINFFKEVSLELVAMEPEPYAIFSSLMWLGKIKLEETVIVLQLGAKESSILIIHSGQPFLMRNLASTGNAMTEAVASFNHCDWSKAEAIKKQEGIKNWKTDGLPEGGMPSGSALSGPLENLVLDVDQSFKLFSQQLKKKQMVSFHRLSLCGGASSLLNLDKFLADRLEVPVDVFNPLDSPNYYSQQEMHPLIIANSSRFPSALGSAVRNIEW